MRFKLGDLTLSDSDIEELFEQVKLDERCWKCEISTLPKPDCFVCHGSGLGITEAGYRILNFIARHQNELADAIRKAQGEG